MNLKYFEKYPLRNIPENYRYTTGDRWEEWWMDVSKEEIAIHRGSEDHGGSWEDKNLADVLGEAVDLWRELNAE
jgi:hypothetical protein